MSPALQGALWAVSFVLLEAIQYVYFGGVFQRLSSFLFGLLVFGITVVAIVAWLARFHPTHLRAALAQPRLLFAINLCGLLAISSYLLAVQLIEPAIAYTIGAGVMPLTALLARRFGFPEGDSLRNRVEALGYLVILAALIYLAAMTLGGYSGFVRGGLGNAVAGLLFTFVDGVFFTLLLFYSKRLNGAGAGPAAVFALRLPLYLLAAGMMVALGVDQKESLPITELAWVVFLGLIVIVPPMYALQKAVTQVSALTISAITALGPLAVFLLQILEGRVTYSWPTLIGLVIYCLGALLAAWGATWGSVKHNSSEKN